MAGFPFTFVVVLITYGLWRALAWDPLIVHRHNLRYRTDVEADHNMPNELPGSAEDIGGSPAPEETRAPPAE